MTNETGTRVCHNCGIEKSLSKFPWSDKKRGTRRNICFKCKSARDRDVENQRKAKDFNLDDCKSQFKNTSVATTEISKDELTGVLTAAITTQGSPADPDEYLASKGINTDKYIVSGGKLKNYMSPMKLRQADGSEVPSTIDMFSITANLIPRVMDGINFGIEEFKWNAPKPKYSVTENKKGLERVIVIPDIHFGYRQVNGKLIPTHDPKALALSLKLIEYVKPDKIVFSGDTFDFGSLSRHPHGIDIIGHWKPTLNAATEYIHSILELTDALLHILPGNHDSPRPLSFIREEIKKLSGVPGLEIKLPTMSRIMGIEDKNVIYHGETSEEGWDGYSSGTGVFKYRDVVYLHGEKIGKDAVLQTMDQYYSNISMGHLHKYVLQQKMIPLVRPTGEGHNHEVKHVPVWGMCPGFLGSCDPELPGMSVGRNYQKGIGLWNHIDMSGGDWTEFKTMPTLIPINDNCLAYNDVVMSV
jgi:hypothetical protein